MKNSTAVPITITSADATCCSKGVCAHVQAEAGVTARKRRLLITTALARNDSRRVIQAQPENLAN